MQQIQIQREREQDNLAVKAGNTLFIHNVSVLYCANKQHKHKVKMHSIGYCLYGCGVCYMAIKTG